MEGFNLQNLPGRIRLFFSEDHRRLNPALLVVWLAVMLLLFRPEIHGIDTVAYYSWLRSTVVQGSLEVGDEFIHYGYAGHRGPSVTGYTLDEWPVGSAILWLPFFLAAHIFSLAGQALGFPLQADGYDWPYTLAVALGSALYALTALHWLYWLAREFSRRYEATLALIAAWLASPLVFYMSGHPFMSHANDLFVNTLFFRQWASDGRPTYRSRFLLGLTGGLAACVRLQNAPLMLWPVADDLRASFSEKAVLVKRWAALAGGFLLGFSPQMVVWRVVFGQWLVANPYWIADRGSFNWASPHFFDVLFSTDRGLFTWTPVALLGVWGLVRYLPQHRRRWALFLGVNFLIQVYVIGSWHLWTGAVSFGQRFLINSVPAFALGLAALYTAWGNRKIPAILTAALTGWNLLLLARYGLVDVPRSGPVPLKDLWLGQFTFIVNLGERLSGLTKAFQRKLP